MDGHGALSRVQDEQLAPGESEQRHLIRYLEIREEGNVLGPFHRAEEQTSGQLADVLDAHDVTGLHALVAVSGRGIGLGPEQERDVSGQVALTAQRVSVGQHVMARVRLVWGHSSSLNRYQNTRRWGRNVRGNVH